MITDLHVNYDYTEGVSNNCGLPSCCKSDSMAPLSEKDTSGKWGDKRCDTSPQIIDSLMDFISNEVRPDFLFWGGDSVGHDVEAQTSRGNIQILKNITK